MRQEIKKCQNCKQDFAIEPEDFLFYKKISVPPPTFCPECRLQRRLAFRNERALYRRKCDLCGEMKVSSFSPAWPGPVYCPKCWWSDKWSTKDYAKEYDFSRPFFKQFDELRKSVPQIGLAVAASTMVNSDFCHMASDLKNCYLVTHANNNEDCAYASSLIYSKDCYDVLSCAKCELCYELAECSGCYQTYFSLNCAECRNVYFSKNLVNCSDCFGCVNLRHKKYHIFNQPYSKEEYFKKLKELRIGGYQSVKKLKSLADEFFLKYPNKYMEGAKNVNVSGDYIYNSKNAVNCYGATHLENSKYCQFITMKPTSECYDYTEWGDNANLVYESVNVGMGISNSKFNQQSWENCLNIEYTAFCISSSNIFGSVSLRNSQYCILNKQYAKSEYEALREKIIKQMNDAPYIDKKGKVYKYGEFFPIEISPWGYNETTADEFFPLTKKEAEEKEYSWTNIEKYKGIYQPTVKAADLADDIKDVDEKILNEIIECEKCLKPFKIIRQEFDFYKKESIALPRLCSDCRYLERFNKRNLPRLHRRKCQCAGQTSDVGCRTSDFRNQISDIRYQNTAEHFHKSDHCPNEFETTYSPERPEIVYCEKCYQAEIV